MRRQIGQDVTVLMSSLGRLSEPQLQLFFVVQSVVLAHKPAGLLGRLVDRDVALAAGALAASLETSSRGLIFDEATNSPVAEDLRRELKRLTDEVTKNGGSRAEREVAAVLRGIERGAKHEGGLIADEPASYLALVARILQQRPPSAAAAPSSPLILAP